MTLSINNITFIIVTFKSEHIISECIESLPKNSKIIVIENSNNIDLKKNLEDKYSKIKVIVQENKGMGSSNNRGIKLCETDYAFVLNPDVKLYNNTVNEMINFSSKNDDFSILAPISDDVKYPNYKIKNKNIINDSLDYLDVDSVDGFAMLINKKKFKDNFYFDESFFLYLENDDICFRKKKEKSNIYILKKAKINHLGGKSSSIIYEKEIEYSRNWHWMWSKFYFYKKHHGYIFGLVKTLPIFVKSFFKYIFYKFLNKNEKKEIFKMRFLGLLKSYMLKKSSYRPYL